MMTAQELDLVYSFHLSSDQEPLIIRAHRGLDKLILSNHPTSENCAKLLSFQTLSAFEKHKRAH